MYKVFLVQVGAWRFIWTWNLTSTGTYRYQLNVQGIIPCTDGSSSKPLSHESSRDESNSILWLLTLFIGNRWGVGPKFFSTTNVEKIEPYI